jgi:hypothetical protein
MNKITFDKSVYLDRLGKAPVQLRDSNPVRAMLQISSAETILSNLGSVTVVGSVNPSIVFDPYNRLSSGVFTCPESDMYRVSYKLMWRSTLTTTTGAQTLCAVRRVGSSTTYHGADEGLHNQLTAGVLFTFTTSNSVLIECDAGDQLSIIAATGTPDSSSMHILPTDTVVGRPITNAIFEKLGFPANS